MNTRKNEKQIIQEFVSHGNNTHKTVVTNSVGMALIRLYEVYFSTSDITDKETTLHARYAQCIKEIYEQAPQDKMSACDYLKKLCEAAINSFDYMTLFIDGEHEEIVFPLKQVITLVWLALNDKDKYKSHLIELNQEARQAEEEKNHADRLLSFYTCLQSIKDNPVCHHGNRNEFVFLLNNIYPGLELIEDERATILSFLKDALSNAILAFYKNKESGLHEKAIHQAILEWIIKDTPQPLITCLGLEDALRKNLSQLFIKHGTNPHQLQLNTLIDHALPCLTFSCDIQTHKGLYFARQLFQSLSESKRHPESSEALSIAREEVRASENLNAPNLIAKLEIFCLFYTTYHYYIENQNLLIITGQMSDLFTALITRLKNYFDEMIKNKSLLAWNLCAEDTQAITQLSETLLSCQKDTLSDQIANFFWKYYHATGIFNVKLRSIQYSLLLDEHFKSKLQLTERDCQNLYASQREGILEIGAYEINRIFLYAIITPVHQWPATFGGTLAEGSDALQGGLFPRVLSFVKNKFEQADTIMTSALKNESYPENLINQLEYLSNKYRIHLWEDLSEEEKNSKQQSGFTENKRPDKMLLLPHQVVTWVEWRPVAAVLSDLGEDVFESYYRQLSANIHRMSDKPIIQYALRLIPKTYRLSYVKKHLHQVQSLDNVFDFLPQQDRPAFIKLLINAQTHIIRFREDLITALTVLPIQEWPVFIEPLGNTIATIIINGETLGETLENIPTEGWRTFIKVSSSILYPILDKNALVKALSRLSPMKWCAFILALGDIIREIIQDEDQLFEILSPFIERYQPALVEALWPAIRAIVKRTRLTTILSKLPKHNWPAFVKVLNNTLLTIIQDENALAETLSQIQEHDRHLFIGALGALAEQNRPVLIPALSLPIRTLITSVSALVGVLTGFPTQDWPTIIQTLGNNITRIIPSTNEFYAALNKIPSEYKPAFILALGNTIRNIIHDRYHFGPCLSKIPKNKWPRFIQTFGNSIPTIIPNSNELLEVFFNVHVADRPYFLEILSELPEQDLPEFLKAFGPAIKMVTKNHCPLAEVLNGLPKQDWHAFILSLGPAISTIIKSKGGIDLVAVLSGVSKQDWPRFVEAFGFFIKKIITSPNELAAVLFGLPKQDRPTFIQALGTNITRIINDGHDLGLFLNELAPQEWPEFIELLSNNIRAIIEDGFQLANVLSELREQHRLEIIQAFGYNIKIIIEDGYQLARVLSYLKIEDQPTLIHALGDAIIQCSSVFCKNHLFTPKINQLIQNALCLQTQIKKLHSHRKADLKILFFNPYHQPKIDALEAFYQCLFTSNLPECNTFASMDPKHIPALLDDKETRNIVNKIFDKLGLERDFQFDIPTLKMN